MRTGHQLAARHPKGVFSPVLHLRQQHVRGGVVVETKRDELGQPSDLPLGRRLRTACKEVKLWVPLLAKPKTDILRAPW